MLQFLCYLDCLPCSGLGGCEGGGGRGPWMKAGRFSPGRLGGAVEGGGG